MIEKSLLRSKATGSGAERWMNCPASVAMEMNLIEGEKKYATAGTKAHEIAAKVLNLGLNLDSIGELVPDDLSDADMLDMIDAVEVYVNTVRQWASGLPLVCEERLSFLSSSGQLDCYAVDGKTGYLFDFKYGVGIKLQAFENEQLAFYACALKEKYPELTVVYCMLVQPRVEGDFEDTAHISSWTLPYQTLSAWKRKFEAALVEVEKAQSIRAGTWCQFCKARGGCPTHVTYVETCQSEQEGFATNLIPAPGDSYLPEIIPRVARILKYRDHVKSWFDKAEEFLLNLAKQGHEIPGFVLAEGRSSRRWQEILDKDELAQELTKRGVNDPWIKKIIPLTQVEKMKIKIDDLIEKPAGKEKLKSIDKKSR